MKWTYLCKWILAILVVVGLAYLHLQANFIPKEILPFVGVILIRFSKASSFCYVKQTLLFKYSIATFTSFVKKKAAKKN